MVLLANLLMSSPGIIMYFFIKYSIPLYFEPWFSFTMVIIMYVYLLFPFLFANVDFDRGREEANRANFSKYYNYAKVTFIQPQKWTLVKW